LTNFLTTTCFGELSGSPALVTKRTFRAILNRRLPGTASRGRGDRSGVLESTASREPSRQLSNVKSASIR
jgi:hypothetical protein